MNELTEESYPAFYERFRDFHDACIKSIQVYFRWGLLEDQDWNALGIEKYSQLIPDTGQPRVVRIELDVCDFAPTAPDDTREKCDGLGGLWTHLRLDLVGVDEFRCYQEENMCPYEIVFSTSFHWEEGLAWIDMRMGYPHASLEQVRHSPLYFVCKSVWWEVFL